MKSKTLSAAGRRRLITFGWIAALAIFTIALIYWEKTAILYILATLGVTALLVVVAMSDLDGREAASSEASTNSDQRKVLPNKA
jgi:hypothetical protein